MTPVTVEPMRWWHVDAVVGIEHRAFPDDPWTVEQFWQELAQPTRHYVVAAVGDELVGYAGAFVLPPDSDVQTICVDSRAQGTGLGRRLLLELTTAARDAGCTHMMLEVRATNTPAIRLYDSQGFTVISTRRRYYPNGDDALIMRADLREAT